MAQKITDIDLAGRGVHGLPDVPGLTTIEMQNKMEEIVREVVIPRFNDLVDEVTAVSDAFSEYNTYEVGDYCIYKNTLYKCIAAVEEAGEWDASHWEATSVAGEFEEIKSDVAEVNESLNEITEITITSVANDYATFANNSNDHAYVKNGVCYLDIGITGKGTYSGWVDIAKLPVKPATNVDEYTPCVDWVNNYNTLLRVISDGRIAIVPRGNATSAYRARMSFPCVKVE